MEALDPWDDLPEHERGPRKTGKNLPASVPPEDQWPGRGEIDGADRHTYMTLRKHFREQAAARRDTCLFCHGAVDFSLRHGSPWAWELHHTTPVAVMEATGEGSALDTRLWASSHAICNRVGVAVGGVAATDAGVEPDTGFPSEDWNAV